MSAVAHRNPDGTCWDCSNPGVWSCSPPCACRCHVPYRSGVTKFPPEPLAALIRRRLLEYEDLTHLAEIAASRIGVQPRSMGRQFARVLSGAMAGLTVVSADRLAIALNAHPTDVWGEQWEVA